MQTRALIAPAPSKSELARQRLFEAAVDLFGEKGPEGTTVREIARAAGQNVAAIAYYFGSKDKLYRAVLEGIVRELRHRLADIFARIEVLRRQPKRSPQEALGLLQEFLGAVHLRLLSRTEAVPIAHLIIREQLRPTAGFEVLYEQGFQPLHEALCFLVATVLGREPREREVMLRTHMLMGQIYFFAMSRQGILRRLGWRDLEGKNAELVTGLLKEHIRVLLEGLMHKENAK